MPKTTLKFCLRAEKRKSGRKGKRIKPSLAVTSGMMNTGALPGTYYGDWLKAPPEKESSSGEAKEVT